MEWYKAALQIIVMTGMLFGLSRAAKESKHLQANWNHLKDSVIVEHKARGIYDRGEVIRIVSELHRPELIRLGYIQEKEKTQQTKSKKRRRKNDTL